VQSDEHIKYKKRDEGTLGDFGSTTPANSFSGGETDHLFLSEAGHQFHDLDFLSGLAHPGDGRSGAILDYDRDGWSDLLVASANAPTFQLYRNRLGDTRHAGAAGARMVALRFVGGNRAAAPSTAFAPRDGYGARVWVDVGDAPLLREHRCGDGRATQHSTTMIVGIGDAPGARGLTVRWPSGLEQRSGPVAAGTLVTVYENPEDSPTKEPFVSTPYLRNLLAADARASVTEPKVLPIDLPAGDGLDHLNVLVAMSTHCKSCKKAQPQVRLLRDRFEGERVRFYGIGTDLDESGEELAAYAREHAPAYEVLTDLSLEERRAMSEHVLDTFGEDLTPVTVVTDARGRILASLPGVPNVSELRKLMRR